MLGPTTLLHFTILSLSLSLFHFPKDYKKFIKKKQALATLTRKGLNEEYSGLQVLREKCVWVLTELNDV